MIIRENWRKGVRRFLEILGRTGLDQPSYVGRADVDRWEDTVPHCDPSVLHAPGDCKFCDYHPKWQEYRIRSRINFTGENDDNKAPCPSTHFRPAEIVQRWGGNRAASPWRYDDLSGEWRCTHNLAFCTKCGPTEEQQKAIEAAQENLRDWLR